MTEMICLEIYIYGLQSLYRLILDCEGAFHALILKHEDQGCKHFTLERINKTITEQVEKL